LEDNLNVIFKKVLSKQNKPYSEFYFIWTRSEFSAVGINFKLRMRFFDNLNKSLQKVRKSVKIANWVEAIVLSYPLL